VKSLVQFTICVFVFGLVVFPAQAAFTSLYIFGDAVSTTTDGPGGTNYYGKSYSNGRVWVEVLAERQGLNYNSNRNVSYYDHNSATLVTEVNSFSAPPDANTALFVVWVNNADFVDDISNYGSSTNITAWNNSINQSLTNHFKVVTNLYFAKGVRTLIMPNAVDITEIPGYTYLSSADKSFIRQRVIDFNAGFAATLDQARALLPGITIYVPDLFALLDNVLAYPANYGLTNALSNGQSIDALSDPSLMDKSLNGPGTNYIFWDYLDPTAKAHAVIGDDVQQLISPVQISKITRLGGSNRLDMANIPIGRDGFVDGSTNLVAWASEANVNSTNATQTIFVSDSDPLRFYRLRFPFAWFWP
jgi:phospholipase/lecithinase/hemolysin